MQTWSISSANMATSSGMLPISVPAQQRLNWCWAAVAIGISQHRWGAQAPFASQCQLVSATYASVYGKPPPQCCTIGNWDTLDACNYTIPGVSLVDASGNPGPLRLALVASGTPMLSDTSLPGMPTICAEIKAGHPICCVIGWGNGLQHCIAIVGYDPAPGSTSVYVVDPIGPTTGLMTLATLLTSYNLTSGANGGSIGRWLAAYLTA